MRKNVSERILELMSEDAYKNLTFKELSAIFASDKSDEEKLSKILDDLTESGDILKTKKGKYGLTTRNGYVKGKIRINPKGFGFVIQEEDDIYISGSNMMTAMDGDVVMAKITEAGDGKSSTEGEVVKILQRNTDIVVGWG